jgi:ubiquinone/menaquinone biosynthesis C-methylase UbiE
MAELNIVTSNKITSGKGVVYMSDPEAFSYFENLYLKVRDREGRIYPDSIVKNLPHVESNHPLYWEWQIRGKSLNKLQTYLSQKRRSITILDLGCGNGWLANRLAQIPHCRVYAADLNQLELEQGARVFSETTSLHFIYGGIFDDVFSENSFDIILLASSGQYFSNIQKLIKRLLDLLKEAGEIHIIDSPFYTEKSAAIARQRTIDYYQELGYPEMADYYCQHRWTELAEFHYRIKYKPRSYFQGFRRRFLKKIISPFPWIVIQC